MDRIEELATAKGVTPSQLALAWVLRRGEDIVPIPGTKRRQYLEENVAAVEIELTEEETEQIASALPEPAGLRYTEEMMRSVGR